MSVDRAEIISSLEKFQSYLAEMKVSLTELTVVEDAAGCKVDGLPVEDGERVLDLSKCKLRKTLPLPLALQVDRIDLRSNRLSGVINLPDGLSTLSIKSNPMIRLPDVPDSIQHLDISSTKIKALARLPRGLISLKISNTPLQQIPNPGDQLKSFEDRKSSLTCFPEWPASLEEIIVFFKTSKTIHCELGKLPDSLKKLHGDFQRLPELPESMEDIHVAGEAISGIKVLPGGLKKLSVFGLDCALPELPDSLTHLQLLKGTITRLPKLPESLLSLNCGSCGLTELPELPNQLSWLFCPGNQLRALPELPDSLGSLICDENHLTSLPDLPEGMTHLVCSKNKLTSLPHLPRALHTLRCERNQIKVLPDLCRYRANIEILTNESRQGLQKIDCSFNNIDTLPPVPRGLHSLRANNNRITELPKLPVSLAILNVARNDLVELLQVPHKLTELYINDNPRLETFLTNEGHPDPERVLRGNAGKTALPAETLRIMALRGMTV